MHLRNYPLCYEALSIAIRNSKDVLKDERALRQFVVPASDEKILLDAEHVFSDLAFHRTGEIVLYDELQSLGIESDLDAFETAAKAGATSPLLDLLVAQYGRRGDSVKQLFRRIEHGGAWRNALFFG